MRQMRNFENVDHSTFPTFSTGPQTDKLVKVARRGVWISSIYLQKPLHQSILKETSPGSLHKTQGSLDLCLRPQGASQSASEKSGILCSLEGPLETPLHLVECKRDSSRVEAGTSVFLSISDSDRKVPACWYRRVRPRLFWRMGLLLPLELFSR